MYHEPAERTGLTIKRGLIKLAVDLGGARDADPMQPIHIFSYSASAKARDPNVPVPFRGGRNSIPADIEEVCQNFETQGIRAYPALAERLDGLLDQWLLLYETNRSDKWRGRVKPQGEQHGRG